MGEVGGRECIRLGESDSKGPAREVQLYLANSESAGRGEGSECKSKGVWEVSPQGKRQVVGAYSTVGLDSSGAEPAHRKPTSPLQEMTDADADGLPARRGTGVRESVG